MYEIRFHGRGGQGTVVASILLAKAFFNAGYYVQTFPLFGGIKKKFWFGATFTHPTMLSFKMPNCWTGSMSQQGSKRAARF
ncbi:MAG: 2-oxoacid:acceptor oxidoreductase family protein [Deltaproteobacteria bacterium]|nr:2-oxoacid:acceptor oxidoreductase family protein [Deltaproteobacteria bacterium]